MNKKNTFNNDKVQEDILKLRKNLMNLNFQKYSGQLEKTSEIRNTKKQIARLKTSISKANGDKNA
tara:strand:+ start:222 stop:416 length:195 start_codon:yes stop_codon:yes gene_type:complete